MEDDSLAENVHREDLHPLDQYRAFLALRRQNMTEEEIAARFFLPVNEVKQRLRLAAVAAFRNRASWKLFAKARVSAPRN